MDRLNIFHFSDLFGEMKDDKKIKKQTDPEKRGYDSFIIVKEREVIKNPLLSKLSSAYSKGYRKVHCFKESESKDAIMISDGIQKEWIPKSIMLAFKDFYK